MSAKSFLLCVAGCIALAAAPLAGQASSTPQQTQPTVPAATIQQPLRHPYQWHPYAEVTVQMTGVFHQTATSSAVNVSAVRTGGILGGLRYYFTPHLAAEINFAHNLDTFEFTPTKTGVRQGLQTDTNETNVNLVYAVPYLETLHPFLLAGGSLMNFGPANTNANVTVNAAKVQNRLAGVVGAGTDIRLGGGWAVRAQLRMLLFKAPNFSLSPFTTSGTMKRLEPSVGLVYRF